MIDRLLPLLTRPRTVEELARELSTDGAAVEGLLTLLAGREYVGKAFDSSPTCGTGCGSCSLQNLCPARGSEAPFMPVWRLTPKGQEALERTRTAAG